MNPAVRTLVLRLGLLLFWPVAVQAQDPAIVPGARFTLTFPDLPQTVAKEPAAMGVKLPKNYTKDKEYPLFLWMGGGNGGSGCRTDLVPEDEFICIGWPLFHKDGKNRDGPHVLYDDADTAWKCYRTMLDKLESLVPNVKKSGGVAGGFSNGGHMIGVLVTEKTKEFTPYFGTFIFWEGGYMTRDAKDLKGKNVLALGGDQSWGKKDTPMGGIDNSFKGDVTDFAKRFRTPKTNQCIVMKGVGHAAPPEFVPQILEWVCRVNGFPPPSPKK